MVQINIEKKHLLILVIFLSLFTIALVIAVNPTTKPNPGHLSNEVMINVGGADKTLQVAIDDGSFGGGISCPSGFTKIISNGYTLGCIENNRRAEKTLTVAVLNCSTIGGRLPSFSEAVIAFSNYALNNEPDNSVSNGEWTDSVPGGSWNTMVYHPSAAQYEGYNVGASTEHFYRCFIPA